MQFYHSIIMLQDKLLLLTVGAEPFPANISSSNYAVPSDKIIHFSNCPFTLDDYCVDELVYLKTESEFLLY